MENRLLPPLLKRQSVPRVCGQRQQRRCPVATARPPIVCHRLIFTWTATCQRPVDFCRHQLHAGGLQVPGMFIPPMFLSRAQRQAPPRQAGGRPGSFACSAADAWRLTCDANFRQRSGSNPHYWYNNRPGNRKPHGITTTGGYLHRQKSVRGICSS